MALAALSALLLVAGAAPQGITGDDAQLRCAATFAIIASEQARAVPSALAYPAMDQLGREFFVRVMAARMDSAGLDRAGVQTLARNAVEQAQGAAAAEPDPAAFVRTEMDRCLPMLENLLVAGE